MIALKRILVPHDFGATSEAAVTYATGLAGHFQAALDVLHVAPELAFGEEANSPEAVRQRFEANGALKEHPLLEANFHVRIGTPHVEISRFAREGEVDLVVMGTHGRGFVAHALLGSVAEKIVRMAPCPVLTVRRPQRECLVPSVLVALDFEPASNAALMYGRTIARRFGAKLHVLHVVENYFLRPTTSDSSTLVARARGRVCERISDEDRTVLHATVAVEVSDLPAEAILDYATNSGINLIVIGTHGRQGASRLLMGSVAERIVRRSSCPVLTVRQPEREFVWPDCGETAASTT
jgi:nucleotide-binding universal stress UspA family protein